MSGLLAVFNPGGVSPRRFPDMAARFPSRAVRRDGWRDEHFAGMRLHHGAVSPAAQPVWSDDSAIGLFLDGELFPTGDEAPPAGDAARRCLDLYRADRPEAFAALNGSFALIVYDRVRRRITLIADRHGSRPLYYFTAGAELAVASHVAALTAHPACPRRLSRQAVHELLAYRRVLGDGTIYRGVEMLPAATLLEFDGRQARSRQYWQLRWRRPSIRRKDAAALLAEGLHRAVRRRLSGGRRVGLLLSGGLDSRIVLAAADPAPVCFTVGMGETAQVHSARRAAALRQSSCQYLAIDPDSYWRSFEEAVRLTGGMYGAQHNHFLPVLEEIGRQCDVLLHGWAMGIVYRDHGLPVRMVKVGGRSLRLPSLRPVRRDGLAEQIAALRQETMGSEVAGRLLTPAARAEHSDRLVQSFREVLRGYQPDPEGSLYHAWDYVSFRTVARNSSYPNILSMRSGLDERTAALDHDLFELFLEMPPEWRVPDSMFRAALERLSPELARLEYADTGLPANVSPMLEVPLQLLLAAGESLGLRRGSTRTAFIGRRSWPNFATILRRHPAFRDRLERLPRSEALLDCGIFDRAGLKQMIAQHLNGRLDQARLLLMLLTLDSWINQFGADGAD